MEKNKNPQEIQDRIFRKMPAGKKVRLASELASFCLKLNSLNGNTKPGKDSHRNKIFYYQCCAGQGKAGKSLKERTRRGYKNS